MLKPGGIFVASTFLKASAPLGQLFDNDDLFRPLNAVSTFTPGLCLHDITLGLFLHGIAFSLKTFPSLVIVLTGKY